MLIQACKLLLYPALLLLVGCTSAPSSDQEQDVKSLVSRTMAGETVVTHDIWIDAPVKNVWNAFTTAEGWQRWSAPVAKVDLKVGGTIKSHYTPEATIGDAGTITLHIINYVPEKVLTLRAELQDNWPEVMKEDHEKLMNVIVFEEINEHRTHVISYGVGYRDAPIYQKLLKFFVPANESLYVKLKAMLEKDEAAKMISK